MTETDHNPGDVNNDECSIVIPICERYDDVTSVYETYAASLKQHGYNCHFYYGSPSADNAVRHAGCANC